MNPDQVLIRKCQAERIPVAVQTSPLLEKLATEIDRVDGDLRTVTLAFSPDEFFLQAMNVVQGGVVSIMLDFALAASVLAELPDGHSAVSTSLTVSFVKPAMAGRFVAVATVDHVGRNCAFARGTLARSDGVIVATATSCLSVLAPRT